MPRSRQKRTEAEALLRQTIRLVGTGDPTWRAVDAVNDALRATREAGSARIAEWRLWWARRIARVGCDLSRTRDVAALDGWRATDVVESARRLVPAWTQEQRVHPGATLEALARAPADPRPHLDAMLRVSREHETLEPAFLLVDRLIELGDPRLALRAALHITWPATLSHACRELEPELDDRDLRRLAKHAWPHLRRWPAAVGLPGYGILARARLSLHLTPEDRERAFRELEDDLAELDPEGRTGTPDLESPVVSVLRVLVEAGEASRAEAMLERFPLSREWDQREAAAALAETAEPARAPQRAERSPSTAQSIGADRGRRLRSMVRHTAQQLAFGLSPPLSRALRPALAASGVEARAFERIDESGPLTLEDELPTGDRDAQWRAALDEANPWTWPTPLRWVALARDEGGDALVRELVLTVTRTLDAVDER